MAPWNLVRRVQGVFKLKSHQLPLEYQEMQWPACQLEVIGGKDMVRNKKLCTLENVDSITFFSGLTML